MPAFWTTPSARGNLLVAGGVCMTSTPNARGNLLVAGGVCMSVLLMTS